MAANTAPIFSLTPNVGTVKISTTSAVAQSDGASTGATTNLMYSLFASGASGSFLNRVRFNTVASAAAVNSVATTLRIFISTVSTAMGSVAGATTAANTMLLAEVSVPLISTANSTNATTYFEIPLNIAIPTGRWILVCQHVAQTTNQSWQAVAIGGDY
jgi:hypothetical protein